MADFPTLPPELHKSQWDKESGVLAKIAGKAVGDGTNGNERVKLVLPHF